MSLGGLRGCPNGWSGGIGLTTGAATILFLTEAGGGGSVLGGMALQRGIRVEAELDRSIRVTALQREQPVNLNGRTAA